MKAAVNWSVVVDLTIRIRLYFALPESTEGQVWDKQLLYSGTSADAHYCEFIRRPF